MKKTLSILLAFILLLSSFIYVHAAPSVTVTYNGQEYASGSSIHYTGSTVTINVSSSASTFTLYINNTAVSANSYTFTNPLGPQYIKIFDGSSFSEEVIINMYNDVIMDPNATYSYTSFKAIINKIDNTDITETKVDYNDSADSDQVNALFDNLKNQGLINITVGGTYKISGYLYVRVFDSNNQRMGDYDCSLLTKLPGTGPGYDDLFEYNWDSGTAIGLKARGKWSANHTYAPQVVHDPGFQIQYNGENKTDSSIEIDSTPYYADLVDKSQNATTWNWYIMTPAHNEWTYFSSEQNPTNIEIWQTGQTYFKQVIDGGLNITHSITTTLKPQEKGSITTKVINTTYNSTIYTESKTNLDFGDYTRSFSGVSPSISGIDNLEFVGSILVYNPTGNPNPSDMVSAFSQTVTLDTTNKTALIAFYVKDKPGVTPTPTPSPTSTPTPTPTPDLRQPPNAIIESVSEVMMGDDISIRSNSYDSDGEIVSNIWTAPTVKVPLIDWGNVTWFDYVGTATISLKVTDNDGLTDYASKTIDILPPVPTAVITYTGRLKENYKITIDSVNSKSPKRYPIDSTKTVWKISALGGCSDSDIKYLGTLTGTQSKDFLVKKSGRIKIELTVINTAGYSNSTSTLLDIQPNLAPVAQLYVPKRTLRENIDENGRRYGETTVYDSSYSPDGDRIIYRKYYQRYDSNNNGKFDEETLETIYEGYSTQATKRYYNDQAVGWCRYDIEVQEDLMEKDSSGNYINTIPEFILPEDIKSANTFYIK